MWAIIGGSGFEKFEGFKTLELLDRETPFGPASSGLKSVQIGQQKALFVSRHGDHHELTPSEVNYRANIWALKKFGAKGVLSFSAVGSLAEQFKPGDMVVPYQYIDRTKGLRASTFCGQGLVGHVSLAHPSCRAIGEEVKKLAGEQKFDSHFGQTYVCIEGPYFSTVAESHNYRAANAQIIGMTHFPEYALVREAGLPYVPCCFVTDYDCWDTSRPHVTLEEVIQVMRQNNAKAFAMAQAILASPKPLWSACQCCHDGLKVGLMTPPDAIANDKKKWLEILIS